MDLIHTIWTCGIMGWLIGWPTREITVSSQTSAPSRIRSIRSGIAIGPSTAVIPQRAPHQASTATAVSKAGAGWRNTARGA